MIKVGYKEIKQGEKNFETKTAWAEIEIKCADTELIMAEQNRIKALVRKTLNGGK